jgi:Metallo-peptidase family M12B Reprolysin-like
MVNIMKKRHIVKIGFLALAIYAASLPCASATETEVLIKEKAHNVYHVIKDKTLLQASDQIARRSGISFKINAANQKDIINKTLAADDWRTALPQFLKGYNFTIEADKQTIKSVIITGRNGSGNNSPSPETSTDTFVDAVPNAPGKLPDRYQNHTAGSVMPVNLPMAELTITRVGEKITLDLPIGQYIVNHDNRVGHHDGSSTWIGYLENEGKGYRVYLSQGEAGIIGNVNTPDGAYDIDTVDGQTYLVDLERSGLKPGGYHNDQAIDPSVNATGIFNTDTVTAAASTSTGTAKSPSANAAASITTTAPIVDLMVLYTTVKQTAVFAKQRLQYLTDVTNQAYMDSKINMRLRLVHTRATNYLETSSNSKALDDLRKDIGAFAGTAALRTKYGADLVFLFRPFYMGTAGSCGTTYVGFSNGQGGNPGTGFGTISDGNSRDNNTNYYCGLQTFAHETGHSLGTVHDRAFSSFTGKFPYSYAWGINNKFGTIMSYYGPSLMFYATPLLNTQCKGGPCGYPDGNANSSDQARTINYTSPLVTAFKPKTVTTPVIQ